MIPKPRVATREEMKELAPCTTDPSSVDFDEESIAESSEELGKMVTAAGEPKGSVSTPYGAATVYGTVSGVLGKSFEAMIQDAVKMIEGAKDAGIAKASGIELTEDLQRALAIAKSFGAEEPTVIPAVGSAVSAEELAEIRAALFCFYEVIKKERHPNRTDDDAEIFI